MLMITSTLRAGKPFDKASLTESKQCHLHHGTTTMPTAIATPTTHHSQYQVVEDLM